MTSFLRFLETALGAEECRPVSPEGRPLPPQNVNLMESR